MDNQPPHRREGTDEVPFAIDPSVPRLARVESFLAGGQAHFATDRAAAESIGELVPGGLDGLRDMNDAINDFIARAVTVLSRDLGVRQYLHIAMTTPTTGMVHHVATKVAADARVVYVSYDPTTLAHVHTLGDDVDDGIVAHVNSPFDDTPRILREAGAVLDLSRPVAVVLPTTLNMIGDDEAIRRVVADLRAAMVPGSYLVMAHTSLDNAPEGTDRALALFNEILGETYVAHTAAEITQFIEDYELLEPGLVPLDDWRPDDPSGPRRTVPIYGAVSHRT
jgi:S-adenosyl methyltransferase